MKKKLLKIILVTVFIIYFLPLTNGEEVTLTSYQSPAVADYVLLRTGEEDSSGDRHFMNMQYDESLGYHIVSATEGFNDKMVFSHNFNTIATDFVIDENGYLGFGTDSPTCPVEAVSTETSIMRIGVSDSSSLTIPALLEVGGVSDYSGTDITDITIYAGDMDCGVLAEGDVYGVFGKVISRNSGDEDVAIYGEATGLTTGGTAIGVSGEVFSEATGGETIAVYGGVRSASYMESYAVKGIATSSSVTDTAYGGYFSSANYGVQAECGGVAGHFTCDSTALGSYGLYATGGLYVGYFDGAASGSMYGLYAEGTNTGGEFKGATFGIKAESDSFGAVFICNNTSLGTRAIEASGGEYAGYFVGDLYINGNMHVSGTRGDLAEVYNLIDEEDIELGDVVVIDIETCNMLKKSDIPYNRDVAGVISGPEQAFIIMGTGEGLPNDKPLALKGKVLCKVTTENGHIRPGDLLVTSSTPGFAMKAAPIGEMNGLPVYQQGCIVAKALESLTDGEGIISVLLCL